MKKIISLILVSAVLLGTLFCLVSCAKTLNGTYEIDAIIATKTYKFSGDEVVITISAIAGDDIIYRGTYEITETEDGKNEITFTFATDDEDAKEYSGTFSFMEADDGSYIKIAGIKYKKK